MPILEASGASLDAALDAAVSVLSAGGVVGLPTDTVYGLASDPKVDGSSDAVFALKGRPENTPLPVLVADIAQAEEIGRFGALAHRLAGAFWPGGLTLVVPRRTGVDWDLGGDPDAIGLRCPDHSVARALCARAGAVTATSANRHGEPPLAGASEVAESFPGLIVLDGGECRGVSSTVVDLTGGRPALLRAGAVAWERIQPLIDG